MPPGDYTLVPSHELPQDPPSYHDNFNNSTQSAATAPRHSTSNRSDDDSLSDLEANVSFQEFEIDDPNNNTFTYNDSNNYASTQTFFQRANSVSRSIRSNFTSKIVSPVSRLFDPVAGLWRYISFKFDVYLGKIGNPLIIKRFLYVFFISGLIYLVVTSGLYPTNKALVNGQFNDQQVLFNFVKAHVDRKSMEESLEYLSSMPHIAGTAGDLALARYVNDVYKRSGISPMEFNEVKSFVNYPDIAKFQLKSKKQQKVTFDAKLLEQVPETVVKENSKTKRKNKDDQVKNTAYLPQRSFNFLSADGTVEGPLLYVNYARNKDFDQITQSQPNPIKDAICIAKYGQIAASTKMRIATDKGCKALIFFKDPKYLDLQSNNGAERNLIEKQSVAFSEYSSGDVLTPGWPTLDSNPKVSWDQSEVTPKIPSLPVSYNDVLPFLKAIKGKGVKIDINKDKNELSDWKFDNEQVVKDLGTDEIWTGSTSNNDDDDILGYVEVQTTKRSDKPLWNIVGKIAGAEESERAIIIAASRDSACYGAINPNTGTTVLLELVRIFTMMSKKLNWKPLRSIFFISIDGTQYNNAGITEWIEERFENLRWEVYAYLDLNDLVGGNELQVKTHPFLEQVILDALAEVDDIDKKNSKRDDDNNGIADKKDDNNNNDNDNKAKLSDSFSANDFKLLNEFGSYYPFTAFAGTPSVAIKYVDASSNVADSDEYSHKYPKNSCFDTFQRFQSLKIDPNMDRHVTLTHLFARIIIKLIDEPLIPFSLNQFHDKIHAYLTDLEQYCKTLIEYNKISHGTLDLSQIRQALTYIKKSGDQFNQWRKTWLDIVNQENGGIEPSLLSVHRWEWNARVIVWQRFTIDVNGGLTGRPWIKNFLFAPQLYEPEILNYYDDHGELNRGQKESKGKKFKWWTFPAIRDAVALGKWSDAQQEVQKLTDLIVDAFNGLNES